MTIDKSFLITNLKPLHEKFKPIACADCILLDYCESTRVSVCGEIENILEFLGGIYGSK